MNDFKIQIDKLTSPNNWTKWKHQIHLLFKCHGLVEIVSGRVLRPNVSTEEATAEQRKELEEFEKKDAQAQLLITNALSDEVYNMLGVIQSSSEAWQRLLSIYEQSSGHRLDRLAEKFFAAKKDPNMGILEHLSAMQRDFHELGDEMRRQYKVELPDQLLLLRMTSTLPSEYNSFRQVWEATALEDRTLDNLIERLRMVEIHDSSDKQTVSAFVSTSSEKKPNEKSNDFKKRKQKIICYKCNKAGHIAKYCRTKSATVATAKNNDSSHSEKEGAAFVCSALLCNLKKVDHHRWIKDSGATTHMTAHREYFLTYEAFSEPKNVEIADGTSIDALGHGVINVKMEVNGKWTMNHLEEVWYVPDIGANLFSQSVSLYKGYEWHTTIEGTKCMKNGQVYLTGYLAQGLTILNMQAELPNVSAKVYTVNSTNVLQLYHERLGHQHKAHVMKILKQRGIVTNKNDDDWCEGCLFGKQHRRRFGTRKDRSKQPGEMISADVCGPMSEKSLGGAAYFLCFKDDYSKFRRVFFLQKKSEVAEKIEQFLAEAETAGHTVRQFLSDGGKEFDNSQVRKILVKRGIEMRLTMAYTPQQNGASERENRTLVESARSMLHTKELPIKLWAEAVNTAAYLLNLTGPTTVEGKSPYQMWHNKDLQDISHLRIFGTECYVHVPKQKRQKWDRKSTKGLLVGYCGNKDGYRVYDSEMNKIVLSRDVHFPPELTCTPKRTAFSLSVPEDTHMKINEQDNEEDEFFTAESLSVDNNRQNDEEENMEVDTRKKNNEDSVHRLRDRSTLKPPAYLRSYAMLVATESENPATYEDAMKSHNKKHWKKAMEEEMKSLSENDVWELTDLPEGKKLIDSRWVLRVKIKSDGSIDRYKARLVAKGYVQKYGIDYDETFSPVARFDTVRTILSVAASEDLKLQQFDVQTAFLYGKIKEEIFMKQPEGFNDGSGRVCRLKSSLYGLKQAPRCWNVRFVNFLKKFGLQASTADPCLFIRKENGQKLLVTIYVDDGLVAASDNQIIEQFLEELRREFKITVGSLDCFLGMEIQRNNDGSIFVHQTGYTKKILKRFNMSEANKVSVPAVAEEESPMAEAAVEVPYREAVGCLMYLMTTTRPDIAFAVGKAAQKLDKPTKADWTSVKRIFKYLRGTAELGLLYKAERESKALEIYTDADFAGDYQTKRSTSGMVSKYNNGTITWSSQKQRSVALSTTEAEFVAASEGAKEAIWLSRLLNEISDFSKIPILYIDNASAVKLIKNPEFHKRSKHIEVRYYFVREKYLEGTLNVEHLEGENQIADLLTKAIMRVRFEKLRDMTGLCVKSQ